MLLKDGRSTRNGPATVRNCKMFIEGHTGGMAGSTDWERRLPIQGRKKWTTRRRPWLTPRPDGRIRRVARMSACWFLCAITVGIAGCRWTVTPPNPVSVSEETTVYLSQYGWHTRLALPDEQGSTYLEYGFGDWHYYALGEQDKRSGLRALFRSESSALSRRKLFAPGSLDLHLHFGSRRTVDLKAPAERVEALREMLENQWNGAAERTVWRHGSAFRKIDRDYALFHNSNHQTADWLEQLGCEIKGPTVRGNFELKRSRD